MEMTQGNTSPDEESGLDKPHQYRILVVDDSEVLAKTMMWMLEMLGHKVQIATDGPTAIEAAKSFDPEIIILDIGIPEMNGYETCQAMQQYPILQNAIFVAHTGWGQKEHRERSKEAGFDYHLVKPVNFEALKSIISTLSKKML